MKTIREIIAIRSSSVPNCAVSAAFIVYGAAMILMVCIYLSKLLGCTG